MARKSKYIRERGDEPPPPREKFTDPELHYPFRYANLDRDMPKWRDHQGRWRCRWCGKVCPGRRNSWCSDECAAEALIRCGTSVRHYVRERDKGICVECGLDTLALDKIIEAAANRISRIKGHGVRSSVYWGGLRSQILRKWGLSYSDSGKSLWDADHILPVEDGGGACGLDGYQTLCVWCHKAKTAKQAGENSEKRAETKRKNQEEYERKWRQRRRLPPEPEQRGLFEET